MRYTLTILLITWISVFDTIGQVDTVVVTVPRIDSSPFNFKITHLWTGLSNNLYTDDNIIKIWTDNGIIDTGSFYYGNYKIKPGKNGKVNIYTLLKVKKSNDTFDTIKTVTSFVAITPPQIITILDEKLLKDSLKIKYSLVFADSKKPIVNRYRVGAFPMPIVVLNDSIEIGEIFAFTEENETRDLLRLGNKIHIPSFVIRDMKTDLIIGTKEFDFKYK